MSFDQEKFTDLTQKYLSGAIKIAKEHHHIELRPACLALALFEDNDGLARQGKMCEPMCPSLQVSVPRFCHYTAVVMAPLLVILFDLHRLMTEGSAV